MSGTVEGADADEDPDPWRRHEAALGPHPATGYDFRIVEYPDRPNECTIAPRDIDGLDLMSTWITSSTSLLVDLGSHR